MKALGGLPAASQAVDSQNTSSGRRDERGAEAGHLAHLRLIKEIAEAKGNVAVQISPRHAANAGTNVPSFWPERTYSTRMTWPGTSPSSATIAAGTRADSSARRFVRAQRMRIEICRLARLCW